MTFTFHMTVPVKWGQEAHPLGVTPDDWFDVEVDCADQHTADTAARLYVKDQYGADAFYTTYTDGPEWDRTAKYRPGECVVVVTVHESYLAQAESMAVR